MIESSVAAHCAHESSNAMHCAHESSNAMQCAHESSNAMQCAHESSNAMQCAHESSNAMHCAHDIFAVDRKTPLQLECQVNLESSQPIVLGDSEIDERSDRSVSSQCLILGYDILEQEFCSVEVTNFLCDF